jgi:hypothetical protein
MEDTVQCGHLWTEWAFSDIFRQPWWNFVDITDSRGQFCAVVDSREHCDVGPSVPLDQQRVLCSRSSGHRPNETMLGSLSAKMLGTRGQA